MVMSLAFHPDDPGSIPGRGQFFIISKRDKKVKVPRNGMQHLNLLQIQENGISELKVDRVQ